MTCPERETIFEFSQRILDGPEAEAVRAHIEQCETCRGVAAIYERVDGALSELNTPEPSPWFDAKLRANLAAEAEGGLWGVWGFLQWRRWLLPAIIVALITLAIVVGWQSNRESRPVAQQAAQKNVETSAPPAPQIIRPAETARTPKAADKLKLQQDQAMPNSDDGYSAVDDYDLLANFDVLSELPGKGKRVDN